MADELQIVLDARNAASPEIAKVRGDLSGLGSEASKVSSGPLAGIGASLKNLGTIAGGFVVAQGIQQLGGFLTSAAQGAADDEAATLRLEQALRNLGGGFDENVAKLNDAIDAGQRLAFSDDDVRDSFQTLAAATGDVDEALRRQQVAMDLARGAGIPLAAATRMVGKVNEENVEAFRRLGIVIGDNATETDALAAVQAKFSGQAATFAGSTAGQFEQSKIALAEIKESIGSAVLPAFTALAGAAAAALPQVQAFIGNLAGAIAPLAGPVFSGIAQGFQLIAGNEPLLAAMAAMIGTVLVPAVIAWTAAEVAKTAALIAGAAAFAIANAPLIALVATIGLVVAGVVLLVQHWDEIVEKFPILGTVADAVQAALGRLAEWVQSAIPPVRDTIVGAWESARDGVEAAVGAIEPIVTGALGAIVGFITDHGEQIKTILSAAWEFISSTVQNAIAIVQNVVQLALSVLRGDWSGAWEAIRAIAGAVWDQIKAVVQLGASALPALVQIGMDAVSAVVTTAWEGIKGAVSAGIDAVVSYFQGLGGRITSAIGNLSGLLVSVGKDIIAGLWRGIESAWDGVVSRLTGLVNSLPGPIRAALGIGSPSRVFADEVGVPISQGIAAGILEGGPAVAAALNAVTAPAGAYVQPRSSTVPGASMSLSDEGFKAHTPDPGGGGQSGGYLNYTSPDFRWQYAGMVTAPTPPAFNPIALSPASIQQLAAAIAANPPVIDRRSMVDVVSEGQARTAQYGGLPS